MSVLNTFVRGAGDDAGVSLVGHVVDGKTIFVVSVTDIAAKVFCVWTLVLQALSIVHITVLGSTARGRGLRGIRQVNEDQAACTSTVPRLRTNTDRIAEILVNDNIVCATIFRDRLGMLFTRGRTILSEYQANSPNRQVSEHSGDVLHRVENFRFCEDIPPRLDIEELSHVLVLLRH